MLRSIGRLLASAVVRYGHSRGKSNFAPDRADHLECGGYARELFGYILAAKRLHGRRAPRAQRIGLEHDLFARQVRRERLSQKAICWPARYFGVLSGLLRTIGSAPAGRQVLQLRLKLGRSASLPVVRTCVEVHPPELVDLRLQALSDLVISRGELLQHLRDRCSGARAGDVCCASTMAWSLGNGIGKWRGDWTFAAVFYEPSKRAVLQHRQCGGTSVGCRQVDTLEQHRQLGARQMDLAPPSACGCRHVAASLKTPGKQKPESVLGGPTKP